MKVELMIKDYVKTLTGADIDVEIIEDTVVLSREERWHIYLIPDRYTMIGCLIDEDIEIANILKKNAASILYIYTNNSNETL